MCREVRVPKIACTICVNSVDICTSAVDAEKWNATTATISQRHIFTLRRNSEMREKRSKQVGHSKKSIVLVVDYFCAFVVIAVESCGSLHDSDCIRSSKVVI